MTTLQKLELGAQVLQENGVEFLATIFSRTEGTTSTPVTCGVIDGDLSLTPFHLSPFEQSECAGVDWIVIAMLAALIHIISWLPRYCVYEPLANARMKGFKTWNDEEARKFSQTATSFLFFSSSAFFAYRVLGPEEWIYSTSGWFSMASTFLIKPDFKFYYLLYVARFLSDLVSIFFESRKKDAFIAAFIHHNVTIGLVLGSAFIGHVGFGGIIMFFFDWADMPLLAAKMCLYLSKDPNDMFQFSANRLFELFALTFFTTRNCFYNFVVYSIIKDLEYSPANFVCEVLLVMLVILQTYWMYLIAVAARKQKESGGNVDDVREKDE